MGRRLGSLAAVALLFAQLAGCALHTGNQRAAADQASTMGNAAAPSAPSSEGAAVAAELGYHGPVRNADAKSGN